MDEIRQAAEVSIGRACLFAALAIWVFMAGLIYEPLLSFRAGAVLTTLVCCVLLLKSLNAPRRPYRRTEVWILIDKTTSLPAHRIQPAIGATLRDIYLRYATWAGGAALAMWLISFAYWMLLPKA